MSSVDSVLRVIEWAIAPAGPPPGGDASAIEQLVRPPESIRTGIGRLIACTTARLRLGSPPLGDNTPATPYTALLALAIAVRAAPDFAQVVMAEAQPSVHGPELVARHGVVGPALAHLHPRVGEELLRRSSLTAALGVPAPGAEGAADALLSKLRADPAGRALLVQTFAQPTKSEFVRRRRASVLDRWRIGSSEDLDFVLDVYEAMLVHHSKEALAQTEWARQISSGAPGATNRDIEDAGSIAAFWGPLWHLQRTHMTLLTKRPYLDYAYRRGIRLFASQNRRAV